MKPSCVHAKARLRRLTRPCMPFKAFSGELNLPRESSVVDHGPIAWC